jgi:hypothetical protein
MVVEGAAVWRFVAKPAAMIVVGIVLSVVGL